MQSRKLHRLKSNVFVVLGFIFIVICLPYLGFGITTASQQFKDVLSSDTTHVLKAFDMHCLNKIGIQDAKLIIEYAIPGDTTYFRWGIQTYKQNDSAVGSVLLDAKFSGDKYIWLITRESHFINKAALLNLSNGSVSRFYEGENFWLSKSGKHILYSEYNFSHGNLFCDGIQIYPIKDELFSISHPIVLDLRELGSNWENAPAEWVKNNNTNIKDVTWISDNEFSFIVQVNPNSESSECFFYDVQLRDVDNDLVFERIATNQITCIEKLEGPKEFQQSLTNKLSKKLLDATDRERLTSVSTIRTFSMK